MRAWKCWEGACVVSFGTCTCSSWLPEIVRAANSICSERVSKGPYVGGGAAVALLVI